MLIIAHRGLTDGPDPHKQNDPHRIQLLLDAGWHVEVDLHMINQEWYLGHDHAQHKVSTQYITQPGLWIHIKDVTASEAILQLHQQHAHLNFFWHESDARVLTSQAYWWTQPGYELTSKSVAVMPEHHVHDVVECLSWGCVGVCTDWGSLLK